MRRLPCLIAFCLVTAAAAAGCAPEPTSEPAVAADAADGGRPAVRPSREPRDARDARPAQGPGTPAVASPPSAIPGAAATATVPGAFQGLWAADAQDCADAGAESRLDISAKVLRFHESLGNVLAADVDGGRLSVALRIAGEGEVRDVRHVYALSEDGGRLTDLSTGFDRRRCTAASPDAGY
jgi:hypothetical protein